MSYLCYFVLVFFSTFSIVITSLEDERTNLSAFRTFVPFALVWFCLFPLPLGVWEGLRFVIVALSYLFFHLMRKKMAFAPYTDDECTVDSRYPSSASTYRIIRFYLYCRIEKKSHNQIRPTRSVIRDFIVRRHDKDFF